MENVSNPIFIDGTYCPKGQRPYPCPPGRVAVAIDNIMFDNITGTGRWDTVINFDCSAISPCRNLTLQRVHLTPISGGQGIIKCNNTDNLTWVDTPHSAQCSTYINGSLTRHGLVAAGGPGSQPLGRMRGQSCGLQLGDVKCYRIVSSMVPPNIRCHTSVTIGNIIYRTHDSP